jgi:hypothetical protein
VRQVALLIGAPSNIAGIRAEINARGRASFMIALNPGQDYTPNEAYYVAFSVLGALKDYVIPVLTAPLTVTSHAAESQEEVVPDPYEYRLFPVKGKHVMLKEQICEIAGKVWDCALLLIRFFEREQISFTGKRVVDIGSGTGISKFYLSMVSIRHIVCCINHELCSGSSLSSTRCKSRHVD